MKMISLTCAVLFLVQIPVARAADSALGEHAGARRDMVLWYRQPAAAWTVSLTLRPAEVSHLNAILR